MATVKELEEKIKEMEVEVKYACKLADKALDMAVEAAAKVEGMDRSTHKIISLDPNQVAPGTQKFSLQPESEMNDILNRETPEEFYPGEVFGGDPMQERKPKETEQ